MKTNTATFENLSDRPTTKYIKQLNWTKDRPIKPGYYWAKMRDEQDGIQIFIAEFNNCDTFPKDLSQCLIIGDDCRWNVNKFSHFMGPLEMPEVPK